MKQKYEIRDVANKTFYDTSEVQIHIQDKH